MSEHVFLQDLVKGRDLHGQDFSGQDLTGAYLVEANLEDANLTGAKLVNACLRKADLSHTNLTDADLSGADLSGAHLTRTELTGAILNNAQAFDCRIASSSFNGASARGANFSESHWMNVDANAFQGQGMFFTAAKLHWVRFEQADLFGARFYKATMENTQFTGAHLEKADFDYAMLDDCNFDEAHLREASLKRTVFKSCQLMNADLTDILPIQVAFVFGNNLSGAAGLPLASDDLARMFESDDQGLIVYKAFGRFQAMPTRWVLEPGAILTETIDPDRGVECSSGIHVTSLSKVWELVEFEVKHHPIWKCRIRWMWLADVVVPYPSSAESEVWKVRTAKLELIEPLSRDQVRAILGV